MSQIAVRTFAVIVEQKIFLTFDLFNLETERREIRRELDL